MLPTASPVAAQNRFVPTNSMSHPRVGHTATLLSNGYVLVTGGTLSSVSPNQSITASAELYDPVTGTFIPIGPMTTARLFHSATLLPDGRVLIAGGTGVGGVPNTTAEIFNPVGGWFVETIANLPPLGFQHTATLLPNGTVLMVGGTRAVIVDPVLNGFRQEPSPLEFEDLPHRHARQWRPRISGRRRE